MRFEEENDSEQGFRPMRGSERPPAIRRIRPDNREEGS